MLPAELLRKACDRGGGMQCYAGALDETRIERTGIIWWDLFSTRIILATGMQGWGRLSCWACNFWEIPEDQPPLGGVWEQPLKPFMNDLPPHIISPLLHPSYPQAHLPTHLPAACQNQTACLPLPLPCLLPAGTQIQRGSSQSAAPLVLS